jgi:exodeoxyribonuclease VII small subunit
MTPAKKPKFEEALERLEKIVGRLEDGETSLDESIKLFQDGRKLGKQCAVQLAEVEKKAQLLLEDENGAVTAEPFDPNADPGAESQTE